MTVVKCINDCKKYLLCLSFWQSAQRLHMLSISCLAEESIIRHMNVPIPSAWQSCVVAICLRHLPWFRPLHYRQNIVTSKLACIDRQGFLQESGLEFPKLWHLLLCVLCKGASLSKVHNKAEIGCNLRKVHFPQPDNAGMVQSRQEVISSSICSV